MKIASILPYKENYTKKGSGAVSLWISDFIKNSIYKKNTYIIGSTKNKNYLTDNQNKGFNQQLYPVVLTLIV